MVDTYCVNKNAQDNGDHEVHKEGCDFWPDPENVLPLGQFRNCHEAVAEAKKHYTQTNGCKFCCLPCHTG